MIKTYLINLDRNEDRLKFFSQKSKEIGIQFERISAIDGRNFSASDYDQFIKTRPRQGQVWLPGQVGCFLSHYHAWKLIAAGASRFSAVFEDDIHISPDIRKILSGDKWIEGHADIIRLETSTNKVLLDRNSHFDCSDRRIYKVKSTTWCAGAYIISRDAAEYLIGLSEESHDAADAFLFNFETSEVTKRLNIYQCVPAPCTQDKYLLGGNVGFKSNIESTVGVGQIFKIKMLNFFPKSMFRSLVKFIKGYKRIPFM